MIGSLQLVEDPMTLLTGWISGGQSAVAGGPDRSSLTMMWYMYDTGFGTNMNYGYAASIAYATFSSSPFSRLSSICFLDRRGKMASKRKKLGFFHLRKILFTGIMLCVSVIFFFPFT